MPLNNYAQEIFNVKTKTLVNIFVGLGALLTLCSSLWWGLVYYFVSKQNGESMWSSLNCIYSIGADCNFLRAMGWLRGVGPYEPVLFWMGVTVLVMSLLLKFSMAKQIENT